MGLCGSIHWKSESSRKNRESLAYAETDNIPNSIPCTPVKNNTTNLLLSTTLSNCGSKEDAFYDSQTWLDSDCDDDFHSVRGDFTPSCGNTPIHSSRTLSPQVNRALFEGRPSGSEGLNRSFRGGIDNQAEDDAATSVSEEKKNKLGDLFDESARSDKDEVKNVVETETPSPSKRTSSPCCFPLARGFKKALFSPPPPPPTPAPPISVDA